MKTKTESEANLALEKPEHCNVSQINFQLQSENVLFGFSPKKINQFALIFSSRNFDLCLMSVKHWGVSFKKMAHFPCFQADFCTSIAQCF